MADKQESKQPYHHGRLREALIEAGLTLLEEGENARSLSLRGVAKRAKVSHAAPYRHFADKQALLSAIAESGFRQLATAMKTAVDTYPNNPRQQLLALGEQYVGFGKNHPAQMSLMFSDLLLQEDNPSLGEAAGGTFEILEARVWHAQQAGIIRAGNTNEIATSIWAMVHGLAMLVKEGLMNNDPTENTPNRIEESIETLLRGLAAEGE